MQDLCEKLSDTYSAGVNTGTPFSCTEMVLMSKYKLHFCPLLRSIMS